MKEKAKSILVVVLKWCHCANGLVFSQSLVTVPEVFVKVNSAQIPSRFLICRVLVSQTNEFFRCNRFEKSTWNRSKWKLHNKGPVHTYLDIFENGDLFAAFQKYTRSHVAYSNRFRPSIENVKQWKRNASSKWYMKSSYPKTSVFVRPHKIFSLENVFENITFSVTKKSPVSNKNGYL